ncbi:hypothetical protein LZ24_00392 [Desulfobotulus alkaliphilus]|uniref:Uncharacterized protein n=1 Tax=Desulfobotulus alkaliphilus TaxID=622671 RepID=A0A562S5Z7_9BACT|nr:hypothetical protein [Desulfobotulus alkaliphilus]TWI76771.1 hypothetical protein LZ24_00392 [Desulfobotulus alkaliphilus]
MTYTLRLFTTEKRVPSIPQLQQEMSTVFPAIPLIPENPGQYPWEQILVRDPENRDLALLCRIPLTDSPLAEARKEKLKEEIRYGRPLSGARWLEKYFRKITTLYEIHPMEEVQSHKGWEVLLHLRLSLWEQVRGIFHTRDEGFTNPQGDLILWEYPPSATGVVSAAVYRFGQFRSFSLNLASPSHRAAFLKGEKP